MCVYAVRTVCTMAAVVGAGKRWTAGSASLRGAAVRRRAVLETSDTWPAAGGTIELSLL